MPETAPTSKPRNRIVVIATAAAAVLAGVLLVKLVGDASAARSAEILGHTKKTPKPLCPNKKNTDNCKGTGSVTGFAIRADGKRGLYKAKEDGHIVGWSVDLSKPTKAQQEGFGELFRDSKWGTAPQAGIAILKKKGSKGSRYTLAKKSPILNLENSLGSKPVFTLEKPLRIQKGRVVGLTMPTWAPLYKDGLNANQNIWKASRKEGECGVDTVIEAKPHLRKGSTRTYGCKLSGERLLYWAYFVPEKQGK